MKAMIACRSCWWFRPQVSWWMISSIMFLHSLILQHSAGAAPRRQMNEASGSCIYLAVKPVSLAI